MTGLNKKEAKVYLALLQLGQETAFRIAKKAGLKRPTVYVILERLKKLGLVSMAKTTRVIYLARLKRKRSTNSTKKKGLNLKKLCPR